MLTTHFRLALRLRMSGGVPLLALCAFMLWIGIAFFCTGVGSAWCLLGPLVHVHRSGVNSWHFTLIYPIGISWNVA
jgi:hypothetical protein